MHVYMYMYKQINFYYLTLALFSFASLTCTAHVLYTRASKGSNARGKSKQMGNQIIRKGWLSMPVSLIKGNSRDFWFVLTAESLTWYKDNDVREFPHYSNVYSLIPIPNSNFRRRS